MSVDQQPRLIRPLDVIVFVLAIVAFIGRLAGWL